MEYKSVIKVLAPWIGTALGGPLGGIALKAAADALGLEDKTVDAVQQAISGATPAQMLSLRDADHAFSLQVQSLGIKKLIDLETIAANDREDARGLQANIKSKVPALLTCFVVGAFTMTLVLLLYVDVPTTNRDILIYMIGQLSGGFTSALAFWLGTTNSSGAKTEMIAKMGPL